MIERKREQHFMPVTVGHWKVELRPRARIGRPYVHKYFITFLETSSGQTQPERKAKIPELPPDHVNAIDRGFDHDEFMSLFVIRHHGDLKMFLSFIGRS